MSISPETKYPGKIIPGNADYPHGQARNITNPGDGTGTPLEQAWVNDIWGFLQAILLNAELAPSGQPDTARKSQYLEGLLKIMGSGDLVKRVAALEGRTYQDTQIGELIWTDRHFNRSSEVRAYKGYGDWERALQGRSPVGFSGYSNAENVYRTPNALYGEYRHTLTVAEMPPHSHNLKTYSRSIDGSDDEGDDTVRSELTGKPGFIDNTGGGQAHNNQHPSQTLDCWKRIA